MVDRRISKIHTSGAKGGDNSINLQSLRRDVNILFYAVSRHGEKLDTLLKNQGSRKSRLTPSGSFDMRIDPKAIDTDASRLRRDVDRLNEVVAKQSMQLDWLTARADPQPETGATPQMPLQQAEPSDYAGDVLSSRADIVAEVLTFCSSTEFLFVAGVSKIWKATWIKTSLPRRTSIHLGASFLLGKEEWLLYDNTFEQAASGHGGIACLAARANNFEGLKAAASVHRIELMGRGPSLRLTSHAAASGNLEMLQWVRDWGCPWDESACSAASENGHLFVLQWLRAQGCPWDSQTTVGAAKGGHLGVLEWAVANGCLLHRYACSSAASAGQLEVVKWAYSLGCRLDRNVCKVAARGGHLSVVCWAKEHGAPWDQSTTRAAAAGGHLDVLIWTRQNGCPWDKRTCAGDAIAGGHRQVVDWILAQRH